MKNTTLITVISFLQFMAIGIISPVNPLYAEHLGASYVAIGLLGATTSLTSIFFSSVWGRTSDHLTRRKPFLVLGLAVLVIGRSLTAVVPSYGYLFPLRVLTAVAQAAYATVSLALMGDLLEQRSDERGRRMGTYRGLSSLGFGLTAFLSGSLADWFSIRVPFALSALILAIAFLLALRVKESSADPAARVTLRDWAALGRLLLLSVREAAGTLTDQVMALIRRRVQGGQPSEHEGIAAPQHDEKQEPGQLPLTPLLVSAFLWSLAFGAVITVWANYMVSEVGHSRAAVGRLWSLAALSEFPLMILTGWLSDRLGRLPTLSLSFLIWTAVFAGYVFAPIMPWIILIQLTRGFAYSAFTATAMTYAAEARPKAQRGWISGLYGSSSGIGMILGSFTGGSLAQFTSFPIMISTSAVLMLGGAIYLAITAIRQTARVAKSLAC